MTTDERLEEFAEEVFEAVEDVIRQYDLEDVETGRGDPMLLAVRGTLGDDGESHVELQVQVSPDLVAAMDAGREGAAVNERMKRDPEEVYRSFALSTASQLVGEQVTPAGEGGEEAGEMDRDDREELREHVERLQNLGSLDELR